jgi:hypothetical protein
MSSTDPHPPLTQERLLEGWLPLAQEASRRYGWGLDAPALEALILRAAPLLRQVSSPLAAHAMLWMIYQQQQQHL